MKATKYTKKDRKIDRKITAACGASFETISNLRKEINRLYEIEYQKAFNKEMKRLSEQDPIEELNKQSKGKTLEIINKQL